MMAYAIFPVVVPLSLLLEMPLRQRHAKRVDRRLIFDQKLRGESTNTGVHMATIVAAGVDRKASERKFYSRMALFLVAVVILGFGPSFYLRDVVPPYPRPNPTLPAGVMFHGGIFTLWMLAIVAQTQLIATRRTKTHMQLGMLTVLLAALMVPAMYLVTVWQVARENQPPFTDPLTWTIIPLAVIIPFAVLVWSGWAKRRDAQSHKRLMLSAAIVTVAGPALGRLPVVPPTLAGFTVLHLAALALFVPLVLWDRRTLGHVHPATRFGLGMAAIGHVVPLIVLWTGLPWAKVAAALPGVGG